MDLLNLLSENSFLGAFIAGIGVLAIVALYCWLIRRFIRAPKVFLSLEAGLIKHSCKFLPSSFLASETSYTISEIEKLCIMHPKITRNKKQLESWCIK